MAHSLPSALITDNGRRVLLRIKGEFYELSQEDLRTALALPAGPPGLGITIDGERMSFEFPNDGKTVEMSAAQLQRRLSKKAVTK